MIFLVLGVLLWVGVHLAVTLRLPVRARLIERLGEKKARGVVALLLVLSILLISLGWNIGDFVYVYDPPAWGRPLALLLMIPAFVLFGAGKGPNNIRRFVRHPQLTAALLWGVAHLLANGDLASVIVFGGLLVWALVTIVLTNRRDGVWARPAPAPVKRDLKFIGIGIGVYIVVLLLHPYIFGVDPLA